MGSSPRTQPSCLVPIVPFLARLELVREFVREQKGRKGVGFEWWVVMVTRLWIGVMESEGVRGVLYKWRKERDGGVRGKRARVLKANEGRYIIWGG